MGRIAILDIFPVHFNVNGDSGNVLALRRRLEWSGFDVDVVDVQPGDAWPAEVPDIVHIGGGSVAAQRAALPELVANAARVSDWVDAGVPVVAVAGGFQVSVSRVRFPGDKREVEGLGIFAGHSRPTPARNSNFLIADSEDFGVIYGYENLGQAVGIDADQAPLGRVLHGTGNAFTSGTEGARRGASIGSQMHGPLIPKNPALADAVIRSALARRGVEGYALTEKHERVDYFAEKGKEIIRERLKFTLPA